MQPAKKIMPRLAVIRGIQPRMSEVNFYSNFERLKIKVIGDKKTGWIVEEKIPKQVEFINSPLYPVCKFDPWTFFGGVFQAHRSFQFVKDLDKHIQGCEIINISDLFYFYCWQSALLAKKFNKKLVVVVWETLARHASTYVPPYCFGVRKVLRTADLFICRSKKAKDYLLSIGADKSKVKVIYKGIDIADFQSKKRKEDGKIRLLYAGQLVKPKGVLELILAFERLCHEFDNLELVMAGRSKGEPLENKVKKIAKRLPILLENQIGYDKMPALYQSADIYCHLSQDWKYLGLITGGNDWFPYAIIEAMASGLPVVATDVGGIPEQLGNLGNILVKQKDVSSTYRGLKRMIQNDKLRRHLGARNRKRAKKMFNIKTQAGETEEAILGLL